VGFPLPKVEDSREEPFFLRRVSSCSYMFKRFAATGSRLLVVNSSSALSLQRPPPETLNPPQNLLPPLTRKSYALNSRTLFTQPPQMASALPVQSASAQTAQTYSFPRHRLRLSQTDASKTPLVLVACGSFSPITYLHLRMFEMAADYVKFNKTEFELLGGYLSPVSDLYKKAGLASSQHRYDGIILC
jgi:hypothetical protein